LDDVSSTAAQPIDTSSVNTLAQTQQSDLLQDIDFGGASNPSLAPTNASLSLDNSDVLSPLSTLHDTSGNTDELQSADDLLGGLEV